MKKDKIAIKDVGWAIVESKDGSIKRIDLDDDLVVDAGLNFYQQRLYQNIPRMSYGAVGTNDDVPIASDTSLHAEIIRKPLSVTTNPSTGKVHLEFVLDFQEANGYTFKEVGIFNASTNGTMLLRKLFTTPFTKASDKKVTILVETSITSS